MRLKERLNCYYTIKRIVVVWVNKHLLSMMLAIVLISLRTGGRVPVSRIIGVSNNQ